MVLPLKIVVLALYTISRLGLQLQSSASLEMKKVDCFFGLWHCSLKCLLIDMPHSKLFLRI